MKRLFLAATALAMLVPAAAFAQSHHDHGRTVVVKKEVIVRHDRHDRWARGHVLPHRYRGDVVVYNRHHLRNPGHGKVWVRADGRFLLIDRRTGMIVATAMPR